jgi:hypothetical protein
MAWDFSQDRVGWHVATAIAICDWLRSEEATRMSPDAPALGDHIQQHVIHTVPNEGAPG